MNRRIDKLRVNQFAAAMARGEWAVNGETIKIDVNGRLIDGQHRLQAIIEASKMGAGPIQITIVSELPDDVFDTLDQGRMRTLGSILQMSGEASANTLAASLRQLPVLLKGFPWNSQFTARELEAVLEEFPSVRVWVTAFSSAKIAKALSSSFMIAVLTAGALHYGDDKAHEFLDKFNSGTNLKPGDSILLLRQKLMESKTSPSKRLMRRVEAAMIIKAWNAFALNRKMGVLKFSSDEAFPTMAI
jgi:hypothetical protein